MICQDAYVLICCDDKGNENVIYPKKFKDGNNVPYDHFCYSPHAEIKYITDFHEAKQWAEKELGSKFKRICFAKVKDIYTVDFKSEFDKCNALS